MFIASFASGQWQSNCYFVAPTEGSDCVIVDPGWGAADMVLKTLQRHNLRPVGILLTHGHIDHIGAAAQLAAEFEIATWIHPADRQLLSDPMSGLPRDWAPMLQALTGSLQLPEPWLVKELAGGDQLDLAGFELRVRFAPGHSGGCVMFELDYPDTDDVAGLLFTGDVLFQGSIGRTDLPGSSPHLMWDSLQQQVLTLPDNVVALPGHGAQTTIGAERADNPFLTEEFWRNQP